MTLRQGSWALRGVLGTQMRWPVAGDSARGCKAAVVVSLLVFFPWLIPLTHSGAGVPSGLLSPGLRTIPTQRPSCPSLGRHDPLSSDTAWCSILGGHVFPRSSPSLGGPALYNRSLLALLSSGPAQSSPLTAQHHQGRHDPSAVET